MKRDANRPATSMQTDERDESGERGFDPELPPRQTLTARDPLVKGYRSSKAALDVQPGQLVEQDAYLENDLVTLLSNFESYRVLLARLEFQAEPLQVLDWVVTMLNEVVATAENHVDPKVEHEPLTKALAGAGDLYSEVQVLRERLDPSVLQWLFRFFNRTSLDRTERQQRFRDVTQRLVVVLREFFALFKRCYRSPFSANYWAQAYEAFLNDLAPTLERLKC